MTNRKGIVSLIVVFIVTMILTFIILVWQSRLVLVVHRSVGLGDTVAAEYNAETEINDILSRFFAGWPVPNPGTKTLSDGTVITTDITSGNNLETLSVFAKRQFASSRMTVTRTKGQLEASTLDKVEIVLGVDCTRSMDRIANPECVGSGCITRITAAENAVLSFLDQVISLPSAQKSKFFVGVETFRIGARWLAIPTNNITNLRGQVVTGFGNQIASSPACVITDPAIPGMGETSLGSAALFADNYLASSEQSKQMQIFILLTDGVPNVSLADSRCGTFDCRSSDGGICTQAAIDYLTCGIANVNTEWKTGYFGQRNPEVDVYGVTVMSTPSSTSEQIAYDATVNVFSNSNYLKQYFNSANAENLPQILQNIFGLITQDVYKYSIQRVVPTLGL